MAGDIPPDKEYSYTVPCSVAHPGLCVTRDFWCWDRLMVSMKSLRRLVLKKKQTNTIEILYSKLPKLRAIPHPRKKIDFCAEGAEKKFLRALLFLVQEAATHTGTLTWAGA